LRLLYLSAAWVSGIYLASAAGPPWLYPVLVFALLAAGLLFFLSRRPRWLLLALSLGLFLAGLLRGSAGGAEDSLGVYLGRTVALQGKVAAEPRLRGKAQEFLLEARGVKADGESRPARGKVMVVAPFLPEYHYGDVLELRGKLEPFPGRRAASGVMLYPRIELISKGGGGLLRPVHLLRRRLSGALERYLGWPQEALAQAFLLGIRGDIPRSLRDAFSRTGTAHLLAISGLHVGVLLGILLSFGAWALGRHRPYYLLLAFLGVWFYALLSGLRPPAFRAAIMGSLLLAGEYLGRPGAPAGALAFAAAFMAGIEPSLLRDVSFQLSFLAMAGLVFLTPHFKKLLAPVRPPYLQDGLAYTLGAMTATFPLVAYYFHILSLVSLPATLITLPVLPGIILASAAVAGFGLALPPLAYPAAWLDWLLLSYLMITVKGLASLPGAFLRVQPFSPSWVWLCYATMAGVTWLLHAGRVPRALWRKLSPVLFSPKPAWGLLPAALLIWAVYLALPDPRLSVAFLDVGNGDAVLVQKGLRQVIIDGGPAPERLLSGLSRRMPFFDRTIEVVVLTHPDADHMRGLIEVLRRYRVNLVLEPGWPSHTLLYGEFRHLVEEKGVPLVEARAGQRFSIGADIVFEVLHPQDVWLEGTGEDEDNNGVVLRLDTGERSFLFTGDLRVYGERELLMRRSRLRADVLKVAHHGSVTSTSRDFLAVVRPRAAVISAAGRHGLPHPEVISRLQEFVGPNLFITADRGTVEFLTDGRRLWVRTERRPPR